MASPPPLILFVLECYLSVTERELNVMARHGTRTQCAGALANSGVTAIFVYLCQVGIEALYLLFGGTCHFSIKMMRRLQLLVD